jgi:hypothetical protein
MKLCDLCYRRRAAKRFTLRPRNSTTCRCDRPACAVDTRYVAHAEVIPMLPEDPSTVRLAHGSGETPDE